MEPSTGQASQTLSAFVSDSKRLLRIPFHFCKSDGDSLKPQRISCLALACHPTGSPRGREPGAHSKGAVGEELTHDFETHPTHWEDAPLDASTKTELRTIRHVHQQRIKLCVGIRQLGLFRLKNRNVERDAHPLLHQSFEPVQTCFVKTSTTPPQACRKLEQEVFLSLELFRCRPPAFA